MAINVRIIICFLDATIDVSKEGGIVIGDLARLFNELMARKSYSEYKIQPSAFAPLCELYCRLKGKDVDLMTTGNTRKIGGFALKSDDFRRLIDIFMNGRGALAENQDTIEDLMSPLYDI